MNTNLVTQEVLQLISTRPYSAAQLADKIGVTQATVRSKITDLEQSGVVVERMPARRTKNQSKRGPRPTKFVVRFNQVLDHNHTKQPETTTQKTTTRTQSARSHLVSTLVGTLSSGYVNEYVPTTDLFVDMNQNVTFDPRVRNNRMQLIDNQGKPVEVYVPGFAVAAFSVVDGQVILSARTSWLDNSSQDVVTTLA